MKCIASLLLASLAVASADLYTSFELDTDYVNNDIGNATEKDYHKCVDHCDPAKGCGAFSWNDYMGGTCWLKSKRGDTIAKKGVVSSIVSATPLECRALDDIDFVDNDIGNIAGKPEECCAKCQKTDKCAVYVWTDFNGGTCWLKSKRGQAVYKKGAKAGDVKPTDAPKNVHYVDVDFVAHDLANTKQANSDNCYADCDKQKGCRAFTWTNLNGGTCWLKANYDVSVAKAGAISGISAKPLAKALRVLPDTDLYDGDLKNYAGIPVKEDCVQLCADEDACKSVAWNDYMKGSCWLKSRNDKNANVLKAVNVTTFVVKEL